MAVLINQSEEQAREYERVGSRLEIPVSRLPLSRKHHEPPSNTPQNPP
jgi:hypothetical protein